MSFLVFLLVLALAFALVKLGALSVWVAVLTGALEGVAALVATVASYVGWRAWKRKLNGISFVDARVVRERDRR